MVFAREKLFLWNFGYHLARTSQSPFPLCDMLPKLRIKCVKIEKFI